MKVQVDELSDYLNELELIEDKYNDFYLNYYNEIFKLQSYWTTSKGILFFNNVNIEKKYFNNFLLNFKNIRKIYTSIEKEYKELGNKIEYHSSEYESFLNKIDDFNNILEKIIDKYNNLNYIDIDYKIKEKLIKEKEKILNRQIDLKKLKTKNKTVVKNVIEKEKYIMVLINKIDIDYIKEINIMDYENSKIAVTNNLNVVDSDKMTKVLNILKNYLDDEKLLLNDLKSCYEEINKTYNSENLKKFNLLEEELLNNIKIIINNHNNELLVLEKEIINIKDVEEKMNISFKNVGKNINFNDISL
jgi:hypothetical protein